MHRILNILNVQNDKYVNQVQNGEIKIQRLASDQNLKKHDSINKKRQFVVVFHVYLAKVNISFDFVLD